MGQPGRVRLAELVLRAASFEQTPGPVAANGFLVDVWRVFEDFVTVALAEALRPYGGRTERQDKAYSLDVAGRVPIRPDLVWYAHGSPAAVVDAKYKAEQTGRFPEADLYQVLAYCTALGLPRGHLVYAKGNGRPARHVVRNSGAVVVCHALDLDQTPAGLLTDVARIAAEEIAVGSAAAWQ